MTNNSSDNTSPQTLYLIRLSQSHTSFRKPELEAIAARLGITISILDYRDDSPFCVLSISHSSTINSSTHALTKYFISHSILGKSIYELYATGPDYSSLHTTIRNLPAVTWTPHEHSTFKFSLDAYCGKRSTKQQREIIEGFSYLPLRGKIEMKKPDQEFVILEEYELRTADELRILNTGAGPVLDTIEEAKPCNGCDFSPLLLPREPKRLFFGRLVGTSQRELISKHDLKKRPYISTTSMDAELALITANLALAAPGKLFLDPFTGTGGFMVAAAELGAVVMGADIDGRSFRGKGRGLEKGIGANFKKYEIADRFGDCVTADLTNSPFRTIGKVSERSARWLDGIICDPPYGVREGLKVLGRRAVDPGCLKTNGRADHSGPFYVDGVPSHTLPGFIAPKRPYSFNRMLDDILDFAARALVDGGRLAFWMPVANDADEEFPVPTHPMLEIKASSIQVFNRWSRRLLVYERLTGGVPDVGNGTTLKAVNGHKADELNQFRRMYFRGFQTESVAEAPKSDHG